MDDQFPSENEYIDNMRRFILVENTSGVRMEKTEHSSFLPMNGSNVCCNEPDQTCGKIKLFTGPMFSGKTSALLAQIDRYKRAGYDCALVKHSKDTRFGNDYVTTHNNTTDKATMTFTVDSLDKFTRATLMKYSVIGIDEGQFFDNIAEFSDDLAYTGKIVVVAALNSTFERVPFACVIPLMAIADRIKHYRAVCTTCGKSAPFSKRITADQSVEVVGGSESYTARCRHCFYP